ncbi:hypothetical protein HYALB_00000479 [Hymenoscyphus albidus]|uniref:Zn(2)-C6 fungal-type domain-containing protein n=1 Tax=Hymenoscyphus albidus TaxID=595503 RepID=A0A9N9Q4I0_9HELO|nr:hypothetical protein HYALB_00000479 [Hymenoscyphus albidus]
MAVSTIPHEENGSVKQHTPGSQSPESADSTLKKRSSLSAGFDKDGNPKPVKRRSAKACRACRSRKVRCDVMQRYHVSAEGEATCTNCNIDGIQCVIDESKRRKKLLAENGPVPGVAPLPYQAWSNGSINPSDISNSEPENGKSAGSRKERGETKHVPHAIYRNISSQFQNQSFSQPPKVSNEMNNDINPEIYRLMQSASVVGDRIATRLEEPALLPQQLIQAPSHIHSMPQIQMFKHQLPGYLKPLPARMTSVDIDYLFAKGALSIPDMRIRNALLQSYFQYVHPYMPLLDMTETLQIIDDETGANGKISLLLFQGMMFAGTAFVDMEYLRDAGFLNRKAARKAFFQRARVLYDFDYEVDRISLVQSLLLMTYWYETPDDQKDTWHWMGVAISLAHTIGLHRDPETSNMEDSRKRLWKRMWWSCFMRDRLVALGMRRPTRVKDEDYDVPMLIESDFEFKPLPTSNSIIPLDCTLIRDQDAQRELAQMCIAKAKLCLCISHVLSAQYSVLIKNQGMQGQEGSTRSSVMLFPKKLDQTDEVKCCDVELSNWISQLPETCQYSTTRPLTHSAQTLFLQRSLLHMIYYTTLSALHRPQVLPPATPKHPQPDSAARGLQDLSRKSVREASREITKICRNLHTLNLDRFLPTTGVTVLLPAIIIHLLDINSCNDEARRAAMDGFCLCMRVLERLRDNYASADFATQFLEAAMRKADVGTGFTSELEKRMAQERAREVTRRGNPQYASAMAIPKVTNSNGISNGLDGTNARKSSPIRSLSQHGVAHIASPMSTSSVLENPAIHGSMSSDFTTSPGIVQQREKGHHPSPPLSMNGSQQFLPINMNEQPGSGFDFSQSTNFGTQQDVDLNDFINFENSGDGAMDGFGGLEGLGGLEGMEGLGGLGSWDGNLPVETHPERLGQGHVHSGWIGDGFSSWGGNGVHEQMNGKNTMGHENNEGNLMETVEVGGTGTTFYTTPPSGMGEEV